MQLIVQPEDELHKPSEPQVEAAWLEEVRRRGEEIDAGQVQLRPADEVFRMLMARRARSNPDPTPPAH